MTLLRFETRDLPPEAEALRVEVRQFLAENLKDFPAAKRAYTWFGYDHDFSRKVAERGWIGMTWPKKYGGGERSAFERYVVLEEMLTAAAPVGAHWVGDRQSGPLLLRYGTEKQRQRFLPCICRGEIFFCIGMSEPDSGSDLASIRTRGTKTEGGWLVNGTKLWTSAAHTADCMIALIRTTVVPEKKHAGMSQLLIDMKTPGITVRTIRDLVGNEHFCEVVFDDTFVPDEMLVGKEGDGWAQVMAELALERSGPERYLSCYPLLVELIRVMPAQPGGAEAAIGRQVAHLTTLRNMSISVAGMLEAGDNPALEASLVKDVGGIFEQALPGIAQSLVETEPRVSDEATDFQQILAHLLQNAPAFSLRGGTREILRGIIARGLGL
jgi:hypothetical protein